MKTKTIMFGMIAMLAFAMFASSLVLAEDNSTSNISNATAVSSGKIFWKGAGIWFTFNQEKKIEKEMALAQLRLQQAEYATQHNMTKAAEKALNSYEKLMNRIDKRNELIQAKNNINASILQLAAMDQAILVHQNRIEKLSNYLANANLTDEQRARIEAKIAKAKNVTLHLQEVQAAKEEKLKTRLMAQGNLSEDEAESEIDEDKDNASEIISGAKDAWKNFKEEAEEHNMTPSEFAKYKRGNEDKSNEDDDESEEDD